jgi:hypothetical protein
MEMKEENEQKVSQTEEDNLEEEKTRGKSKNKSEVQGDGFDDAKEAMKINKVDMMRQDFACISLKTKNKELDLLAKKSLEIKSKDDETKEEAKAKVNAGIKTENQEGALEDTVEVDKDETDEEDMVKTDEVLFNREEVPEARTESRRKSSSQLSKNWRLKEMMMMLILLLLQGDVVMKKTAEKHLYEKPEERDVMAKNNPNGKHDEVNVVRERVNTRAQEDRFDKDTAGHGCPACREGCPLDHLEGVVPLVGVVHDPKVVNDLTHNEGDVTDVHVIPH